MDIQANMELGGLERRVLDLERQISMYERLFQTFSAKLDHHFKKYDLVINAQQQQINVLTDIVSTMLNDQYRYAGILRDKLRGSLDGIVTTSTSIRGMQPNGGMPEQEPKPHDDDAVHAAHRANHHHAAADDGNRDLTNVDAILGEFIPPQVSPDENELHAAPAAPVPDAQTPAPKRNGGKKHPKGSVEHKFIISNGLKVPRRAVDPPAKRRREDPQKEYEFRDAEFSALASDGHPLDAQSAPPAPQHHDYDHDDRALPLQRADRPLSTGASPDPSAPSSSRLNSNIKEEQYYTHRGLKKKRKIYVGKFEFLNSPQTVLDIWKEYTEGFNGQPSLKDMETMYQTSWRRDPAVNKRFHRRKVLCKAIERGLERGYDLQDVVRVLEDSRLIDASRNLKQPIGWLCQGVNIPDLFK
ncbi:ADL152Wp [Eremothecium gossypii ATCC 10895]|uniref:ADL152Wp n=1 Tax=Eremothecium gossypii (strain ATCC 10895 / CBS 109.51 / FGSC 9923 / NRRL Y-1056) TaxID=284811 RepID=Q75AS2_EREGS|nr:ADL152Wp [Eremothecium gossypii ATCC 10895]AAS51768.1 ADL152Wp [Eremothecium gossypii ATCC 10895]AEY96065.1 FADL152Wp [Eremothecium gossypii FDAG1]